MKNLLLILLLSVSFSDELKTEPTIADSLPNNIPFVKSVFWGDNGMFRDTFVDPKSRMKELRIRRNMLQLHQRFALFTLGAMIFQSSIGFKMTEEGDGYNKYQDLHMNLGYLTFGTYMTAASLSIFSPPGMKYTKRFSSNKLHQYLALIHFAGMAAQPWLGYQTSVAGIECQNGVPGRCDDRKDMLNMHKTVGTITVSTYFLAFLTTLFK
jgi:hypothetical protein